MRWWLWVFICATFNFQFQLGDSLLKAFYRKEENRILKAKLDEESITSRQKSINISLFLIALILTFLTSHILRKYGISFIHETYISIFFGVIIGLTFNFTHENPMIKNSPKITSINEESNRDSLNLHLLLFHSDDSESRTYVYDYAGVIDDVVITEKVMTFKPTAFFSFILPPIIYSTALKIRGDEFLNFAAPIAAFSFLGSALSIVFTTFFIYLFHPIIKFSLPNFSFNHALAYSIFVSCTDPITVLAIFETMNVEKILYYTLFGESALNDAVCLIADGIMKELLIDSDYFSYFLKFCYLFIFKFIGSMLIGICFGIASSLFLKHIGIKNKANLELTFFILFAYMAFVISNSINMIAIVSLIFCAIVQSSYALQNLSDSAKDALESCLEMLKYIMENIVFLQIGLILVSSGSFEWTSFIFVSNISMVLSRVILVVLLSMLINRFSLIKISPPAQVILILAAMRGGISYALAMNYNDTREQRALLTATLVSILFPIFACGLPMPFFISKLKLNSETKGQDPTKLLINPDARKMNFWRRIDVKYLTPFLTSRPAINEENLIDASLFENIGANKGLLDNNNLIP